MSEFEFRAMPEEPLTLEDFREARESMQGTRHAEHLPTPEDAFAAYEAAGDGCQMALGSAAILDRVLENMSETKDQALERRMVAAVKISPTDGQYGLRHIVCGIEVGEAHQAKLHAELVKAAQAGRRHMRCEIDGQECETGARVLGSPPCCNTCRASIAIRRALANLETKS